MSATVFYRQKKPIDKKILQNCDAPSSFVSVMQKIFDSFPVDLDDADIPKLEVLHRLQGTIDNPYFELIHAINDLGLIHVWSEY